MANIVKIITTGLQSAINALSNALSSHVSDSGNPHQVTKGQVGLSNVPNLAFSGTNTGDETTSSIQNKRPLKTINSASLEGTGNIEIQTGVVINQTPITGGAASRVLFQNVNGTVGQSGNLTYNGTTLNAKAQDASTSAVLNVEHWTNGSSLFRVLGNGSVFSNGGGGNISNTAYGQGALVSNSSGNNNAAYGVEALRSNSTGFSNTANGVSALLSNTIGNNNTANGVSALRFNTTGFNNTANGVSALFSNTTGFSNTANGVNSGRFIANGSNLTVSNQSLFLGADTRALNDNSINEIVVGFAAVGNGNNTATIGNDSILRTVLKGNVGIGTSTPAYTLDVQNVSAGIQIKSTSGTNRAFTHYENNAGYFNIGLESSAGGSMGIGTLSYSTALVAQSSGGFSIGTAAGIAFYMDTNRNIGVNTSSPTAKLHVRAQDASTSAVVNIEHWTNGSSLFRVDGVGNAEHRLGSNFIGLKPESNPYYQLFKAGVMDLRLSIGTEQASLGGGNALHITSGGLTNKANLCAGSGVFRGSVLSEPSTGSAVVAVASSLGSDCYYRTRETLVADKWAFGSVAGNLDFIFRSGASTMANGVERMRLKSTGVLNLATLPTSSAGLVAGDIWNDSGTLKIV